jgi:hypothetical protein
MDMKKIAFFSTAVALAFAPMGALAQDSGNAPEAGQTTTWAQNGYEAMPTNPNPEPSTTSATNNGNGYNNGNENGNGNGFGNWNQSEPFSVSVFGQANRGGISASGFMGEQGEAGSATSGFTVSNIGGSFDSCAEGCAGNRIYGEVAAGQMDEGFAYGVTTHPGSATVAESVGSSATRIDFGAGFNGNCVGPCGGSQPSSNGGQSSSPDSGH